MQLIADILMAAGTFGAAIYCYVLAARLKKFSTLESGMGGAIAVLSVQVDDMTKALDKARGAATNSATSLEALTGRSEAVAARLELLLASMHDLPDPRGQTRVEPEMADISERKLRFVRRRTARDDLEAAE
ncbi:MAG: hypothetical protein U1D35_13285 [Paracoccaceae bacterium]|nr:hypothetical protein [Paracoccaceae bacterium]